MSHDLILKFTRISDPSDDVRGRTPSFCTRTTHDPPHARTWTNRLAAVWVYYTGSKIRRRLGVTKPLSARPASTMLRISTLLKKPTSSSPGWPQMDGYHFGFALKVKSLSNLIIFELMSLVSEPLLYIRFTNVRSCSFQRSLSWDETLVAEVKQTI